jgi:hypothetical protein
MVVFIYTYVLRLGLFFDKFLDLAAVLFYVFKTIEKGWCSAMLLNLLDTNHGCNLLQSIRNIRFSLRGFNMLSLL